MKKSRWIKNFFGHLSLVLRHKRAVFRNCRKCGIVWRGLVHDLSKFSPVEFFESVRYFQGNRSPIGACRRDKGISYAWLHHKGKNKHHIEYWLDGDCAEHPMMPYKYAVECVCDKLAATRVYLGRDYNAEMPLYHWEKDGSRVNGNPKTMRFISEVFADVKDKGEDFVLSKTYMKEKYRKICGFDN